MIHHFFYEIKIKEFPYHCLAATLLFIIVRNAYADPQLDKWEPSDWFQAEVVIFQQIESPELELPPRNYELAYPTRWRKLIDTKKPIKIADLARIYDETTEIHNPFKKVFVQNTYDEFQATSKGTAPIARTTILADNFAPREKIVQPIFELPYSRLQAKYRSLNETAAGLRRRSMYNVLFHEAWRFPAETKAHDRWIIIQAGSRFKDRFQLEGSIRFYKSRFMHFESRLWLSEFTETNVLTKPISLPRLGSPPINENGQSTKESSLNRSIKLQSEAIMLDIDSSKVIERSDVKRHSSDESLGGFSPKKVDPHEEHWENLYPVKKLWTLDQTRKLRKEEIHYLDHPEFGIIVTVNTHQPVLLNPEHQPDPVYEETNNNAAN